MNGSRKDALCDRLLFSAMIEARSCERFKVLSENIKDPELAKFYRDLMISKQDIIPHSLASQKNTRIILM
jgi:tRNA-(ms[2]io[6]A)-hydroxylase